MKTARSAFVVAFIYLAIVLALWLPFNPRGGMAYETGWIYTSEISTWWNGFLNGSDLLRIYTSIFYQVAYLAGELFGVAGSFVPYQIVYAALWWARGFLLFLIGRRLAPGHDSFWYLVGALALIHSSDGSIGWVGQINQFGYIFWMLAAFYALVLAFEQRDRPRIGVCLVSAAFLEHLSLWSYEGQFPVILIAPLLLIPLYRPMRKWLSIAFAWYIVPAIYAAVAIFRYAHSGGHTYEQSVLRKSWSAGSILSDWLFNISASLRFWAWAGTQESKATASQMLWPAVLAVAAFSLGTILLAVHRDKDGKRMPDRRDLWKLMLLGALLVVTSFAMYVLLESARSLWRTQILSGLGAALIFAAIICFFASLARKNGLQLAFMAALAAPVIACGSFSAVKKAAFHESVWERHRSAMAQVLEIAPRLKPGTLVILTGVPRDRSLDPFLGDNMWFDMALRLAYPGTPAAGVYFHEDGRPAAGGNVEIAPDQRLRFSGIARPAQGGVDALLVLQYDKGVVSVMQSLPGFLQIDANAARLYDPQARIQPGNASPRAVRRYLASAPSPVPK